MGNCTGNVRVCNLESHGSNLKEKTIFLSHQQDAGPSYNLMVVHKSFANVAKFK
jgi:hypothetical protein